MGGVRKIYSCNGKLNEKIPVRQVILNLKRPIEEILTRQINEKNSYGSKIPHPPSQLFDLCQCTIIDLHIN